MLESEGKQGLVYLFLSYFSRILKEEQSSVIPGDLDRGRPREPIGGTEAIMGADYYLGPSFEMIFLIALQAGPRLAGSSSWFPLL